MIDLKLGNVLDMLAQMPSESVHCIVTSPPYWGLRAYGTEPQVWRNGSEPCQDGHEWGEAQRCPTKNGTQGSTETNKYNALVESMGKPVSGNTCTRCGAWRGELGLEPTPELFVEHIVAVMREARRVLRADGTAWINLGDSYAANGAAGRVSDKSGLNHGRGVTDGQKSAYAYGRAPTPEGLKPKDLVGIPWRVAFALQADGWYLRSDIIWHKPNPMPESVRDRPTKAHEYIFLMSKQPRYYYDAEAIRESGSMETVKRLQRGVSDHHKNVNGAPGQTPHSMNKPRPHASRGADFTPPSSPTLRPELFATLLTEDGSVNCRGWLDFGQSQVSINGTVTGDTERFQIVELVGFKVGLETPKGNLVVNLEIPTLAPAMLTSGFVPQFSQASLSEPVIPAITDATTPPSGAILTSHVFTNPLSGTFVGTKIVGLDCALISSELFSARITLEREEGQSTLFVWSSLASSHCGVSFIPESLNNIIPQEPPKRNRRSVWTVTTHPYSGAHFATFPPKLIEPCILAATSERGVCSKCGAPWVRVVERGEIQPLRGNSTVGPKYKEQPTDGIESKMAHFERDGWTPGIRECSTTGWRASCDCDAGEPVPATVLDPFNGAGTTGLVALQHGRRYIGIDLKQEYLDMTRARLEKAQLTMAAT